MNQGEAKELRAYAVQLLEEKLTPFQRKGVIDTPTVTIEKTIITRSYFLDIRIKWAPEWRDFADLFLAEHFVHDEIVGFCTDRKDAEYRVREAQAIIEFIIRLRNISEAE